MAAFQRSSAGNYHKEHPNYSIDYLELRFFRRIRSQDVPRGHDPLLFLLKSSAAVGGYFS